jgi:hypothetical protein
VKRLFFKQERNMINLAALIVYISRGEITQITFSFENEIPGSRLGKTLGKPLMKPMNVINPLIVLEIGQIKFRN